MLKYKKKKVLKDQFVYILKQFLLKLTFKKCLSLVISASADFEHYFSGSMNLISLEQLGDTRHW